MGLGSFASSQIATRRAKSASDRALRNSSIGNTFVDLTNLTLSYNELVESGRVRPGAKAFRGLQGDESLLSHAIGSYEDQLAKADPIFGQYRNSVQAGLKGLENGGIPDDMRRSITENLRSSQASRGILDSNTAAIEEVVRLMGGQEAIRSQRLGEAQDYFGSVTQGALNAFLPNVSSLYGGELQKSISQAGNRQQAYAIGSQIGNQDGGIGAIL